MPEYLVPALSQAHICDTAIVLVHVNCYVLGVLRPNHFASLPLRRVGHAATCPFWAGFTIIQVAKVQGIIPSVLALCSTGLQASEAPAAVEWHSL